MQIHESVNKLDNDWARVNYSLYNLIYYYKLWCSIVLVLIGISRPVTYYCNSTFVTIRYTNSINTIRKTINKLLKTFIMTHER